MIARHASCFESVPLHWTFSTYIRLIDGGTVGLDFTPVDDTTLKDDAPIVVVMHGLTGGSHESYVRDVLSKACAPVDRGGLGYRGVVVNFRGCKSIPLLRFLPQSNVLIGAGTPITSQQLYSAGWTEDLRQSLMYIAHRYPGAPMHGLGFSLGSNVIVRYLGEEKENSRLSSACVLGCVGLSGPFPLQNVDMLLHSLALGSC